MADDIGASIFIDILDTASQQTVFVASASKCQRRPVNQRGSIECRGRENRDRNISIASQIYTVWKPSRVDVNGNRDKEALKHVLYQFLSVLRRQQATFHKAVYQLFREFGC